MARSARAACAIGILLPVSLAAAEVQKIEVTVERKSGGTVERMEPNHVFRQGDLVRFRFRASFDGYLYVMDQSTSGKYLLLFPKAETGLENRIERDRSYLLPMTESGWFRVEGPPGYEVLYWVVSPASLTEPGAGAFNIPRLPDPSRPLNPAITPRCDDTIFRARGECIDVAAGGKPITDTSQLPSNLAGIAGAKSRELTVTKSDKRTSVMSAPGEDGLFLYTFRLAHQ